MSGHEIIEAETRWARAIQGHYVDRLNVLMHPNFMFLGLRTAGVESWSRTEFSAAIRKINFRALDHKVRDLQVFGQTAVATVDGRWTAEAGGVTFDELFMMTDVWTKAPGGPWRVVRRHSTRYTEDAATHETREGATLSLEI